MGRILGSTDPRLNLGHIGSHGMAAIANFTSLSNVRPVVTDALSDFFTNESMGVQVLAKCGQCKNCPECAFLTQGISRKELTELEMIKNE